MIVFRLKDVLKKLKERPKLKEEIGRRPRGKLKDEFRRPRGKLKCIFRKFGWSSRGKLKEIFGKLGKRPVDIYRYINSST